MASLSSKYRSDEEIRNQMDARMAELEKEAVRRAEAKRIEDENPINMYPCHKCLFYVRERQKCSNPLMRGFMEHLPGLGGQNKEGSFLRIGWDVKLCGPEGALWQPIPTKLQKLKSFIVKLFID